MYSRVLEDRAAGWIAKGVASFSSTYRRITNCKTYEIEGYAETKFHYVNSSIHISTLGEVG